MTQTEKNKAIKKVEIAIDKMIDLQNDFNFRFFEIQEVLDRLNNLRSKIENN